MTMCDVRCTSLGVLELKAKDKLECPYHPRQTHIRTNILVPLPLLYLFIYHYGIKSRKTPREKEEIVVFVRQMGMYDRMIRLGKIEAGSGRL